MVCFCSNRLVVDFVFLRVWEGRGGLELNCFLKVFVEKVEVWDYWLNFYLIL